MTRWRLEWNELADKDLWEIWNYVAAEDRVPADRLISSLTTAFDKIADYPHMGHFAEGLGEDYRILSRGNYLLIYRLIDKTKTVELMRVTHGARDLPRLFTGGD